jgi:hypothetical protein
MSALLDIEMQADDLAHKNTVPTQTNGWTDTSTNKDIISK